MGLPQLARGIAGTGTKQGFSIWDFNYPAKLLLIQALVNHNGKDIKKSNVYIYTCIYIYIFLPPDPIEVWLKDLLTH